MSTGKKVCFLKWKLILIDFVRGKKKHRDRKFFFNFVNFLLGTESRFVTVWCLRLFKLNFIGFVWNIKKNIYRKFFSNFNFSTKILIIRSTFNTESLNENSIRWINLLRIIGNWMEFPNIVLSVSRKQSLAPFWSLS